MKVLPSGETLAGVDFTLRLVAEHHLVLARDLLHPVTGGEEQVSIGQRPQFIATRSGMLPLDVALGGYNEDFALGVIRAREAMTLGNHRWSEEPRQGQHHGEACVSQSKRKKSSRGAHESCTPMGRVQHGALSPGTRLPMT